MGDHEGRSAKLTPAHSDGAAPGGKHEKPSEDPKK